MIAKRLKVVDGVNTCARCQENKPPLSECSFAFPDGYRHWKAIWQARTGKRLTNLRKKRLADKLEDVFDLKALSQIVYWMDLCFACWEECSIALCPGFPQEYWEYTLRSPGTGSVSQLVATKINDRGSAVMAGR